MMLSIIEDKISHILNPNKAPNTDEKQYDEKNKIATENLNENTNIQNELLDNIDQTEYQIYEIDADEERIEEPNIIKQDTEVYHSKMNFDHMMAELKEKLLKKIQPNKIALIKKGQKISIDTLPKEEEILDISSINKTSLVPLNELNIFNGPQMDMMEEFFNVSFIKRSHDIDESNYIE